MLTYQDSVAEHDPSGEVNKTKYLLRKEDKKCQG
jgi:hypothetical protein